MTATFVVPTADELALVRTVAARYRVERAAYKKRIRLGLVTIDDVFNAVNEGDKIVGYIRIESFLRCLPAIGPIKADRICGDLGVHPHKRLGGLGRRQRAALQEYLNDRERTRTLTSN